MKTTNKPFTDDDLKRLEKMMAPLDLCFFSVAGTHDRQRFDAKALLTRLKAAEACIIPEELIGSLEEKYEAWCNAAGK